MRNQILSEIEEDLRKGREGQKDEGRDAYDVASDERDREINFLLSDRERAKLQAIDEALERIDQKTYGICESCEGEIAQERLKAMPFTRLCVQCQQEQESEARRHRRSEEGFAFRRFGNFDLDEEQS